jgi:osmotically-inducible protein OsmY
MTGKHLKEDDADRIGTIFPEAAAALGAHRVELDVRRQLLANPRLHFSSLVVRRVRDGVCLEGVVETDERLDDVGRFVGTVAGVNTVLNRLVHRRPPAPAKG